MSRMHEYSAAITLSMRSTMEPHDFAEIIGPNLADMFAAVLEDPELMHAVAHLLVHATQVCVFCQSMT